MDAVRRSCIYHTCWATPPTCLPRLQRRGRSGPTREADVFPDPALLGLPSPAPHPTLSLFSFPSLCLLVLSYFRSFFSCTYLRSFELRLQSVNMFPRLRRSLLHPQDEKKTLRNHADSQSTAAAIVEQPTKAIRRLLHWDDLLDWQRDNHHILTGYREASFSFLGSLESLTYLHNQTVNIYTHLIPSLLAIPAGILLHRALVPRYETASQSDVMAFGCFFVGAAFSLGMSATFHTIMDHSPLVARVGNTLDYIGIVGLIIGSFVPSVYYGFYCLPALQRLYWGMICTIGLCCTCVSVIPQFRTPQWRSFRAVMFVSMGLSAVFPVVHGVRLYGVEQMARQIGLGWLLLQGFLYILAASVYAARIPERFRPGKFDILGSSHQIFHLLVVCAAVAHLKGLLTAFDYRHSGLAERCLQL